jgi:hypothetical protein
MEPQNEHHPVLKKCQRLHERYKELLGRHRYLREQLTSIQGQIISSSPNPSAPSSQEKIDGISERLQELQNDEWLDKLFSAAENEAQVEEIERYMQAWGVGKPEQNFDSRAHCIIWHADKHGGGDILRYLRKANNFNKRRARMKWVFGAKRWRRKSGEFMIERDGKIVSYGHSQ